MNVWQWSINWCWVDATLIFKIQLWIFYLSGGGRRGNCCSSAWVPLHCQNLQGRRNFADGRKQAPAKDPTACKFRCYMALGGNVSWMPSFLDSVKGMYTEPETRGFMYLVYKKFDWPWAVLGIKGGSGEWFSGPAGLKPHCWFRSSQGVRGHSAFGRLSVTYTAPDRSWASTKISLGQSPTNKVRTLDIQVVIIQAILLAYCLWLLKLKRSVVVWKWGRPKPKRQGHGNSVH